MKDQLNRLLRPKTNAPSITYLLAKLLNVKLTEGTIKNQLELHPDYPSLLAISDVLSDYYINNMTLRIEERKLIDVPTPFITQIKPLKSAEEYFTIIKEITSSTIKYLNPESQKWQVINTNDFYKQWTGIILIADAEEEAGEANYQAKAKKEKQQQLSYNAMALWLPVMILLAGIASFINAGTGAILPFTYTLLTFTGVCTGFLLLWYEHDRYNPVLTQFCGGGDKKVNCSAILSSDGSKIAGVSWSTLGFSYFTGSLLLQIIVGILDRQTLFISGWLSIVVSPYVLYSVYYQWRIARYWCSLCLLVQAVLLLQLGIVLAGQWYSKLPINSLSIGSVVQLTVAFTFPFIITYIIFNLLRKVKKNEQAHIELQRFKHDSNIFEILLKKQQKVKNLPDKLGIQLGGADAPYKIIKVCNPYCGPCAKAHPQIEEVLNKNPNVQLQIIFTATDDEADYRAAPVKHLMAIHDEQNEELLKEALNSWYLADEKDYTTFANRYKMNGELKQQGHKLTAMAEWCRQTDITLTPTFFISLPADAQGNSEFYKLPEIYNLADLKYLLSV